VNDKDSSNQILSVDDLSTTDVKDIFTRAKEFKSKGFSSSAIYKLGVENAPVVGLAFFEPSTRTKLSFDSAAQRIGCKTIGFDNPSSTSSSKGEQLQDTIKVIEQYCDAIVIRRKEHGTIDVIRDIATKPVISAGVGAYEHPTQALLDVFTISEHRDLTSIQNVVSYGDLINSRVLCSQVRLLARDGITFTFVADDDMQIDEELENDLTNRGAKVVKARFLDEVIQEADILNVLRPQRERWGTDQHSIYPAVRNETLEMMKQDALVLHPLPRTGELAIETDSDPRSIIWEQVQNGLFIRAAILEWILS
jgi:aspartate carbamoyltransferase catalytic subunit